MDMSVHSNSSSASIRSLGGQAKPTVFLRTAFFCSGCQPHCTLCLAILGVAETAAIAFFFKLILNQTMHVREIRWAVLLQSPRKSKRESEGAYICTDMRFLKIVDTLVGFFKKMNRKPHMFWGPYVKKYPVVFTALELW